MIHIGANNSETREEFSEDIRPIGKSTLAVFNYFFIILMIGVLSYFMCLDIIKLIISR